jgi:hypothetical protein
MCYNKGTAHQRGGVRGRPPAKILKFRLSEIPAILESSWGDFVILSKYLTKNIVENI